MKLFIKLFMCILCGIILTLLSNKLIIDFWVLFLAYAMGVMVEMIWTYLDEYTDK